MFAGGGAIPLEVLRLGCESYALDLNPVAHIIQLCTLVYPQKFGRPEPRRFTESCKLQNTSNGTVSHRFGRVGQFVHRKVERKRRKQPLGSGAIESTCRQYQIRFKRAGQFWSLPGDESLLALETLHRNGRWQLLFPHAQPAATLSPLPNQK